MKIRQRKRRLYLCVRVYAGMRRRRYRLVDLLGSTEMFELTAEDYAWINMQPAGREFGSHNHDELVIK